MPRVIEVIESELVRGKGTEQDVCRIVMQYWTLDGKEMLAERDPCPSGVSKANPTAA